MRELLLINPVGRRSGYLISNFSTFSPLGLAYVAAVTPPDWNVRILDENFDVFKFQEADLVGITAFTSTINRAYELSREYRKRNIKVIIGGIHASMSPDESLQFSDSVVIGEAEAVWPEVIKDFENNRLKRKYIAPRLDLSRFAVKPRRDLLNSNYLWNSVQTSRGCPFDCHFCTVSKYLGRKYRQREAEHVIDELEEIEDEYIAFVDDNLIGYSDSSKNRSKKIFEGMIQRKLKKKWWMQASVNSADDERIVELAAQSGCIFVFIGFETIDKTALRGFQKGINLKIGIDNYRRVVDTFHKYGIGVMGAFIIGNDHESFGYYQKLADFLVDSGIDIVQISILTPLPGTQLMDQLKSQNRLNFTDFPKDWNKYRFSYMVHEPVGITEPEIYAGDNYVKNRLYSFPAYQLRLIKSMLRLKNRKNTYAIFKLNQALKRSWKNSHYYRRPSNHPEDSFDS